MNRFTRGFIGLISVAMFLGGVMLLTPLGSEAEAGGKKHFKKYFQNHVSNKDLEEDHDKLGEWIDKMEANQALILEKLNNLPSSGGGGGVGNHTLRWDRKLDSTNGSMAAGREGCDSSRFKCIFGDTAVLDLETGLVWERSPQVDAVSSWSLGIDHCATQEVAGRKGWSLPMLEQLASLVDTTNSSPALPTDHPFLNVQSAIYWSATTVQGILTRARLVQFSFGVLSASFKDDTGLHAWCVRGGQVFDGNAQ